MSREKYTSILKENHINIIQAVLMICFVISLAINSDACGADNAFGIDEINWSDEDWASIAMTNDDTVTTGAIVRAEPDTDSVAVGYLYRGSAVKVVEKEDEWTEVVSGKVMGYVKNEYLMFGDEAKGLAAYYGEEGVVSNWDDVNIFSEADANSSITNIVSAGEAMSLVEDGGHWIAIQMGADSEGFVSEEDVTRVLLVDTAVSIDGEEDGESSDGNGELTEGEEIATFAVDDGEEASRSEILEDDSFSAIEVSYDTAGNEAGSSQDDASLTYTTSTANDSTENSLSDSISYSEYYSSSDAEGASLAANSVVSLQELYAAYITAQNAAMSCTSTEDAQEKAAKALEAWNIYLEACSAETAADSSYTSEASSTEMIDETTVPSEDGVVEESDVTASSSAIEGSDASDENTVFSTDTSADTAADSTQISSSGSGSYGGYSDLDLLAAIIWCEAGNQPYDGMVAIGQVVMNRVKSSSFPNSIAEVLNQSGQFTPSSNGTLQTALAQGEVTSTCYQAAQDALNGATPVPGYPLYFNTYSGDYQIGDHYFS